MMELPGGLWDDGACRKSFAFKPITGHLELAVMESEGHSVPQRVTAALAAALAELCGAKPRWERVHRLSVGDRQFLMRRLALLLEPNQRWLTHRCRECESRFDFFLQLSSLPVKPAGPGFPFAAVETGQGVCRLRAVTGADQEAIALLEDMVAARRTLIQRSVVSLDGKPPPAELNFSERELENIENALERIAPEVATEIQAPCPECAAANRIAVDPYECLARRKDSLYQEIHALAWHYHWSEKAILALPRPRRTLYLQLIDRARGMSQ